jgi:hypothetical protein
MQTSYKGASRVRQKAMLGMIVLGLVVSGCDCKPRPGGSPAPSADIAPQWKSPPANNPTRLLREMPASTEPSAYELPLDIKIETPEVPPGIRGPTPDVRKLLRWIGL